VARDSHGRIQVVKLYCSTRRGGWLLVTAGAVALLMAWFGQHEVALPSADGGGPPVPFWRLFAAAAGVLPVLTLVSPLSGLEGASSAQFARCRTAVLVSALVFSGALAVLASLFASESTAAAMTARAVLAWFGLALLSGRVLAWSLCWVLPWAVLAGIVYWGYDSSAAAHRWWEFTARPVADVASLLFVTTTLLAGIAAYSLTPWRLFNLRGLRRRLVHEARRPGQFARRRHGGHRTGVKPPGRSPESRSGAANRKDV